MNPVEDGSRPAKDAASEEEADANAQDQPLTPHKESGFSGDLLDELFSSDDPRLESGIASGDSDNDIDFIRMSGLTSPEIPAEADALNELPDLADDVPADPVSFYEPGVADVDASMTPMQPQEAEPVSDDVVPEPVEESPETTADAWDAESRIATALEALDSAAGGQVESDFDPGLESSSPIDMTGFVADHDSVPEPLDEVADAEDDITDSNDGLAELEPVSTVEPDSASDDEPQTVEVLRTDAERNQEIIDLDSLEDDDDVFPDLTSPDEAEPALSEPAENVAAPPLSPETASILASEPEGEDEAPVVPGAIDETSALDDTSPDDTLAPALPEPRIEEDEVLAAEIEAEILEDHPEPATVQTFGRRSSRHHRRHQPSWPRLVKAAAVLLLFGGALAFGGYEAYRWFEIQVSNPTTIYYEAESAAAAGRNLQSARLFEEFARRNPSHDLAADALFAAGYQMQQVESEDRELSDQYDLESLALLDEFLQQYPDHERAGRARSLAGFVHYRMGNYNAAIDAFIDRDAILRDPAATLPMLRTLARSYAQVGEYEAAHTTFIRAANSPGNATPDEDYDELGEMYRALAQSAESEELHREYQDLALEHWSYAMRYPGINPTRKNAIRVKVDLLGDLGKIEGTPLAMDVRPQDAGVVVPVHVESEVNSTVFEEVTPLPFDTVPAKADIPADDDAIQAPDPSTSVRTSDNAGSMTRPITTESSSRHHEIGPGDQLSMIAAEYGVSTADLMKWNAIDNPDHIEIGQRLVLDEPASPGP